MCCPNEWLLVHMHRLHYAVARYVFIYLYFHLSVTELHVGTVLKWLTGNIIVADYSPPVYSIILVYSQLE